MTRLFGVIVLLMFGSGLMLIAQSDDDTTDNELTCDEGQLLTEHENLEAMLEDFAEMTTEDAPTALEALYEVGLAYQALALECGYIPDDVGELYVGDDVDRIMTVLENVTGDPINGQLLYSNQQVAADGLETGCVGCHIEEVIAPLTEGTWTRWDEIRSLEPQFEDYSFEQYMVESIVLPWAYTVPDYPEMAMPNNYGGRLSYQDLADIIAFLNSQDQFLD